MLGKFMLKLLEVFPIQVPYSLRTFDEILMKNYEVNIVQSQLEVSQL